MAGHFQMSIRKCKISTSDESYAAILISLLNVVSSGLCLQTRDHILNRMNKIIQASYLGNKNVNLGKSPVLAIM